MAKNMNKLSKHTLAVLEFPEITCMLLKFADSGSGKKLITQLFPSTDPVQIRNRIAETSEIKDQYEKGRKLSLAGIIDVEELIEEIDSLRTPFEPQQLLDIASTLDVSENVRVFFDGIEESAPLLCSLTEQIGDFRSITNEITRCIDPDKNVRDSASSKLKELRKESRNLNADIQRKLQRILRKRDLGA